MTRPEPGAVPDLSTPVQPPAAEQAPAVRANSEEVYLDRMRAAGMGQYYASDTEAVFLGEQVCSYLDRDAGSKDGAADVLIGVGFTSGDAAGVVLLAVHAFCPKHA